jgi:spore coat polysaccharide biosynthesis predicted glycosyltransferase SpsG
MPSGAAAGLDLLYHCDSYPAIGMGHLSRAINVLNEFCRRRANQEYRVAIAGTLSPAAVLFRDRFLDARVEHIEDGARPAARLCVIDTMFDPLDANYVDRDFCCAMKARAGKLGLIEGVLGALAVPTCVDFLVNHIPDVAVTGDASCRTYLGFGYAPVTAEFVRPAGEPASGDGLLIVIGGNDRQSGPAAMLEALSRTSLRAYDVTVIVSPHYPAAAIEALAGGRVGGSLAVRQSVDSLVPFFRKAAAIICTYGNTTYEALTYHLPTLVCSYKKFQNDYAAYLESKGLVLNLGYFDAVDVDKMNAVAAEPARRSLVDACRKHFNRPGIDRIVDVLMSELAGAELAER